MEGQVFFYKKEPGWITGLLNLLLFMVFFRFFCEIPEGYIHIAFALNTVHLSGAVLPHIKVVDIVGCLRGILSKPYMIAVQFCEIQLKICHRLIIISHGSISRFCDPLHKGDGCIGYGISVIGEGS